MSPVPFFSLAVLSTAANVLVSLGILRSLQKRDVKVNLLTFRLLLPWYVHQYGEMTKTEGGRAHSAFYAWIISINLVGIFFLLGLLVR